MKIAIYFLMLLLVAGLVNASYISITSNAKIEVANGTLTIRANVTNKGDESAHNVQVWVDAAGESKSGEIFDRVGIEQTISTVLEFDISELGKGRYPVIMRVDYADANLYMFSALTSSYYVVKENVNPDVFASLSELEISKTGTIKLTLKNLADKERPLNVKLALPKELSSFNTEQRVTLSPKSEKTINFEIDRFSALIGSTYVVYAIVEYDENDAHYTTFAQNFVKVVEKKSIFNIPPGVLIAVVAVLIIAFIALQFKKKK